ncbi:WD40-repeat-containing domain protein [Scheffersomyces xylosifermentans]|uniref:WD40-repeat-containing domain protein n=1 Tax=Scheffersomyces xylosifermentans TaxID=1304137 RepID=UPI00315E0080
MSSPIVYQLGNLPIKDHVFSPDHSLLAVTKDNTVEIYQVNQSNLGVKPKLFTTLAGHDKTVTSVDISFDGTRILTCSQDRNALVWEYDSAAGEYKPTLVLLRISRAATVCKWSPDGQKFAVGSSDRIIAVCYYEQENNWWVSKHLKKPLKSTITSLSWHHNGVLLASGSTDGHVRVFSAFIKGLDEKPEPTPWGSKLPFQTLCGDFINETGAWIHDVAFSPDGNSLAFVSHDSSVGIIYPDGEGLPPRSIINVKTNYLPFKTLVYLTNNKIVVGGHNCNLIVFEGDENDWKETRVIESQKDLTKETPAAGDDDEEEISSHQALNMFKQMDLKGRLNKPSPGGNGKVLSTTHQNTIASIREFSGNQVSTSGIDGKIVIFRV